MKHLLTIVWIALAANLTAQQKQALTIEEALTIAMKNNVQVISAQNDYNSASANVLPKTVGKILPTVDASMRASRTMMNTLSGTSPLTNRDTTTGSASNSYSYSLTANYVLFDGFRNWTEASQARLDESAARYNFERTRQSVTLDVYEAYINVLKNQQLLRINEENLKRSEEQLKRLEERNKLGAQILSDVYKQRVQVGSDKLSVSKSKNNLKTSKASLASLIGIDVNSDLELKELNIASNLDVNQMNFDEAYGQALQNRKDYLAAESRVQSARRTVSIARSGFYPTVNAFASYAWNDKNLKFANYSNNDNTTIGLSVSIPIFSGFETNSRVIQQDQSLQTARSNAESTKRKVALDVKIALLNMQTAYDNMKLSEENVKAAKEDLRLATEKYNLGAGTILDQITANASYAAAEANYTQSAYDFVYAKQQYLLAVGTLDVQ